MKILHISWALAIGGIENMLVDIINYQVKFADVSLLLVNNWVVPSIINRLDKRCKVIKLGRKVGSKNPVFLFKLNGFLFIHHFDIVHLHDPNMIENLWLKRNYVRTVHNTNIDYHNYRWHKCIIAISESVKQDLAKRGICKQVVSIDNGINFNLIKQKQNSIVVGSFKMVQVSRILFDQKGQDILVDAIEKLVKGGITDIHLDFIGTGPDQNELSGLIQKKKMNDFISILGDKSREYVYEHLCNYDLFVQPSRFEGFGLTVAEAMGAKIPVLVSNNEGPLSIIENGKYGFTFKNESVNDCAAKILHVMNNYPDAGFLEKAFEHVHSFYRIEKTAQMYLDEYKKILN